MGILSKVIKVTAVGAATTTGTFLFVTRKSTFSPVSPTTDAIFQSSLYNKFNPNHNPTMHDLCVRKVPISKIKPSLRREDGKLAEAFCAGVWSGVGYAYQRQYLFKKYHGPSTEHQLWSPFDLKTSDYPIGTQITDHFEVLEHTPTSITVRCGDSPLNQEVRGSDGLFEMSAVIRRDEGIAEFKLKSVFYQGLGKATGAPMPAYLEFLHRQYTKLLMETAIENVMV